MKGATLFSEHLYSFTEEIEQAAAMTHALRGSANSQYSEQSLAVAVIFWYEKSLIRNCLLLPFTNLSLYPSHERVITVAFLEPPALTEKLCVLSPVM